MTPKTPEIRGELVLLMIVAGYLETPCASTMPNEYQYE